MSFSISMISHVDPDVISSLAVHCQPSSCDKLMSFPVDWHQGSNSVDLMESDVTTPFIPELASCAPPQSSIVLKRHSSRATPSSNPKGMRP